MGTWEEGQKIKAEAQQIMLEQMKILQEQTRRAVSANEGVPALNISAMSQQIANIGRVLCGNEWRPKQ